jgi:hypothetical protein
MSTSTEQQHRPWRDPNPWLRIIAIIVDVVGWFV